MAALAQTAVNVALGGAGTVKDIDVVAGETIAQGMPYYLKTSDGKMWKADADAAASALARGIALTPASADGLFVGVRGGPMNVGGTLSVGSFYFIHTTAGAIGLIGELTTGDFPTSLGQAISASVLQVDITQATVALA